MTNEERLEERLIDAHSRGYYEKVLKRTQELRENHPKMIRYDLFDLALNECKSEWELKNNYDY